jgi:hypothetical protein
VSRSASGGSTGTVSATSGQSTSASPARTAPQAGSIHFNYTDKAHGWNYVGSIPFPIASVSVTEDTSTSPPGKAKIALTLTTSPQVQTMTFSDANPTRPNGSQIQVAPGVLVFPIAGNLSNKLESDMLNASGDASADYTIGPCSLSAPYQGWWGIPNSAGALFCATQSGSGTEGYDLPESDVMALAAAIRGVKPSYAVNLDQNDSSGCNEVASPSGRVQQDPNFSENCNEKLTLTVNPPH